MAELGRACGIRAGVASVEDPGFAKAILKERGDRDPGEKEE